MVTIESAFVSRKALAKSITSSRGPCAPMESQTPTQRSPSTETTELTTSVSRFKVCELSTYTRFFPSRSISSASARVAATRAMIRSMGGLS